MQIGLAMFHNPLRNAAGGLLGAGGFYASLLLPLIVIAGIAVWLMLPEPSDAGDEDVLPVSSAIILKAQNASADAQPAPAEPVTVGLATASRAAQEATPPEPSAGRSPLEKLRIASQSWRRGGLGSKALVTLTLRNANDFAVKDIEIACAFARRDGSHLTERRRLINDPIAMKSRRTYSRILIGFVNINANKAKCSLVTASRL